MRIQPLDVVKTLASILLLLPLAGCCGEYFRGTDNIVAFPTISPLNASIQPGTTQQFSATGRFGGGTTGDVTALTTWTSSDPTIATITNAGLATGIKFGTVTISGNCECYISQTNLTVGSQTSTTTAIAVTPASASIAIGNTQQSVATATNSNGTSSVITSAANWTSSDSTIATVSSGGLVTGVTSGKVTITASSGSVRGSATLVVQ
jgi:uncharacterized protein YjdB